MNGLLRNNFYSSIDNARIALGFLAALGLVLVVSGSAMLLSVLTLAVAPILALLAVASLRKESFSKWSRYKLTLPVRRCDIVKSYYFSHLFWCLGGTLVAAVFLMLTLLVHGDHYFYYGFRDAFTLVLGGCILAVLIGVIAYPLYIVLGHARTEVVLLVSCAGAIGIVLGLSLLINIFTGSNDINNGTYYGSLAVISFVTVILCFMSYCLTVRWFAHKEL